MLMEPPSTTSEDFNPLPLYRGRPGVQGIKLDNTTFQSSPSIQRETKYWQYFNSRYDISILSLYTEGDCY